MSVIIMIITENEQKLSVNKYKEIESLNAALLIKHNSPHVLFAPFILP
jgi:hypothetical protein